METEAARRESQQRLQVVPVRDDVDRATTILHAVLQKWRNRYTNPLWHIEAAWVRNLHQSAGYHARPVIFAKARVVRIDVDADLVDSKVERAVTHILARLQMTELSVQCLTVIEKRIQNPSYRETAVQRHEQLSRCMAK